MSEELVEALETQDLEAGQTIGLKALCQASGLSVATWAEKLKSPSVGFMIQEELRGAGYTVTCGRQGRFWRWTFS